MNVDIKNDELYKFYIGIRKGYNNMPRKEDWDLCRQWLISYFCKKAVDGEIPCAQVEILADMHLNNLKADAFRANRIKS